MLEQLEQCFYHAGGAAPAAGAAGAAAGAAGAGAAAGAAGAASATGAAGAAAGAAAAGNGIVPEKVRLPQVTVHLIPPPDLLSNVPVYVFPNTDPSN